MKNHAAEKLLQNGLSPCADITIEELSGYPSKKPDSYIPEIGVGIDSNVPQGR